MALLDQSKTVIESMHNLLTSVKAAAGNAKVCRRALSHYNTNCDFDIIYKHLTQFSAFGAL
jgi:hypothetical protein